jgi:uncharacterized membrane protein
MMMRRDALWEYLRGSLWVLPTISVVGALIAGSILSQINVGAETPLAFQGTADDARALLIGITGTMVTVIALLLGLTVVALQLSSTQFSPRILRNFLRDRANLITLSSFVATFAYAAAGLYTVGVSGGTRTTEFPRLAVTGAMVLLFVALCLLVFFGDHLAHSLQIDAIMGVVERNTLAVIREGLFVGSGDPPPVPDRAVPIPAGRSGYVQAVHADELLSHAGRYRACLRLLPRVGEHVVEGTTLAWVWSTSPDDPAPTPQLFSPVLARAVRIGFERTLEQDAAFGIRQLIDVACKALSPAVNDPYTAIQAVDHLSVIFFRMASRRLGHHIVGDPAHAAVIVPGWQFSQYLAVTCGLIRRYGASEPTVAQALLRLLARCAGAVGDDAPRRTAIEEQARLIVADAERRVAQPADLAIVHAEAETVQHQLADRRPGSGATIPGGSSP